MRIIGLQKNYKNLFIKLLIFCIRNLIYEDWYVVGFFIKYFDSAKKKNALIVHFRNFGVQKFLQTPKMTPYKKG